MTFGDVRLGHKGLSGLVEDVVLVETAKDYQETMLQLPLPTAADY